MGARIDLAYARGRTGKRDLLAESKQQLQSLVEPPKQGPDPPAAPSTRGPLLLAELTLRATPPPGPRRAAAQKAQTKALPTDVLFQEDLARANTCIGDGGRAALMRELVIRLPQRRSSRIFLPSRCSPPSRSHDTLNALGPLYRVKDKGKRQRRRRTRGAAAQGAGRCFFP